MERQPSPTSSTPAVSKNYVVEENKDSLEQASPTPLVESELTQCGQSTILDISIPNISMETNCGSSTELAATEETVIEVREKKKGKKRT